MSTILSRPTPEEMAIFYRVQRFLREEQAPEQLRYFLENEPFEEDMIEQAVAAADAACIVDLFEENLSTDISDETAWRYACRAYAEDNLLYD